MTSLCRTTRGRHEAARPTLVEVYRQCRGPHAVPPGARRPARCAPVTSTDGVTADYYPLNHAFLGRVANCIIEVRGIDRVTDDITSNPSGTIDCE